MKNFLTLFLIFFVSVNSASAQLSLPDTFTNNMVLQRGEPIHIWGNGIPNKSLKIEFGRDTIATAVRQDSTWSVYFKKSKSNSSPQSIYISSGLERIVLSNILIGDVWLCAGQSNMEWSMEREMHFDKEKKNVNLPSLRFYNTTYAGKNIYNKSFNDSLLSLLNENDFYDGRWAVSDSISIKRMSAVGYYFGKEILEQVDVPIGLINMAIGGAPIEAFIGRNVMEGNSLFSSKVKGNWLDNNVLPEWIRERGHQNVGDIQVLDGDELGPNHAFKPGFAYSAGIKPLFKLPIKGIIWYQGESNAQEIERVNEYGELQKLLIEDYRQKWKQPEMPFYWVQLSSIDTTHYNSKYWPKFRDEQRELLNEIENGGMAVSSDIGFINDVHPTNKKDVGYRLARWALNKTYGKQIVPSGPLPITAKYIEGKIIIDFAYTANGLKTSDNQVLRGFSIDGIELVPAKLCKHIVEVTSQYKPEYVYYGWQPFTDANLVNSENLPASTFKLKVN
ncbi:sialate O-acetylesterase [Maribacter sp. HTCC2170]|uniref:sialate O-acetylesterase n=1 Tax=Maribacter sp. (strain HTCC2170 / KCCM 42371) TaxID=313603 RepID=UPI0011D272FE|nr:sialate O-acetylesterase [Maribacter sp. HTCC2170]